MAPRTASQVTDDGPAPKLLSVDQSATTLGVSTWTVRRLLATGKLAKVRIGTRVLVRAAEIEKFIDQHTETPIAQPASSPLANEEGSR